MKDELVALVGAENVLDHAVRGASGWYPPTLKGAGDAPRLTVRPGDADEVAAVVRWANAAGATLCPVGGGSGVAGAPGADIALDLSRLQDLAWDERALTVTAGAGVTLALLEERLGAHGYTVGAQVGSANLASVGGAVAVDAVGALSGRYGTLGERVVALEVVLPTGAPLRVVAGPFDLRRLFIGGEGRFGVIVAATLRMQPAPEVRAWAFYSFDRTDDALEALRLIHRSDARPAVARLLDDGRLILGFEGDELVQAGHYQLACAVCQQLGGAAIQEDGDPWLEARGRSNAYSANARPDTWADIVTVAADWGALPGVYRALRGRGKIDVAHPDPTGAALEIAFTLTGSRADYDARVADLYDAALESGGWVAPYLGVGEKARAALSRERGPVFDETLAAVAAALDPRGVMGSHLPSTALVPRFVSPSSAAEEGYEP